MSHPFLEAAGAIAVVMAVGVWTVLVLPRPKPTLPAQTIMLEIESSPVVRAEPQSAKSDIERVSELERQVSEIAAEQKRLAVDLRLAVEARSARGDRERRAR